GKLGASVSVPVPRGRRSERLVGGGEESSVGRESRGLVPGRARSPRCRGASLLGPPVGARGSSRMPPRFRRVTGRGGNLGTTNSLLQEPCSEEDDPVPRRPRRPGGPRGR